VILLGAFMTDINLGIYTARLDPARSIYATSEKLSIRYHTYEEVRFKDFMGGLLRLRLRARKLGKIPRPFQIASHPTLDTRHSARPVTVRHLFERLNAYLSDSTVVVADVGDALFGAADLFIREHTEFISPAYYTSMGFAVPACIGAQLANPKLRPLVLVGDGAFQMTGMELSTCAKYNLHPIVCILNNDGYGTQRHIIDGAFNNIHRWQYTKICDVLNYGKSYHVTSKGELEKALKEAAGLKEMVIIEVILPRDDCSRSLRRMAEKLGELRDADKRG
jgi:indolepyruvate decarboxylase